MDIKNLIFDLGGVIINISAKNTIDQFAALSNKDPSRIENILTESGFMLEYELGLISDTSFRDSIRASLGIDSPDKIIDAAWNAMLLEIPLKRIALLKSLRKKYRTFVLSNTNSIHLRKFNEILYEATGIASLESICERTYYSHIVHQRKPEPSIFKKVLEENNLEPAETLFVDDTLINLEGAQQVGIQTFHIKHPEMIFSLPI